MTTRKKSSFLITLMWSIYFLFLLFLQIIEITMHHSSREIIDLMVSLPSLVGLFAYIFHKRILVVEVWRVYFFVFLTWHLYRNVVLEWISHAIEMLLSPFGLLDIFIYLLLFFPLYYALYKIGFSLRSPLLNDEEKI